MNTLQEPKPIDFYSMERDRVKKVNDLNTFNELFGFDEATDPQTPSETAQVQEQSQDAQAPTQSAESIPGFVDQVGEMVPQEAILPPDTINEKKSDDADKLTQDRLSVAGRESTLIDEEKGIFGKGLEALEFVASPLMAFGDAALAPISHQYESEGFVNQVGEALQISGQAFMERMLPTYGEQIESYGRSAAEVHIHNAPEHIKSMVGTTLDIVADPTVTLSLPFVKVLQAGQRAANTTEVARGGKDFIGIVQEGVSELFGAGNLLKDESLSEVGRLAQRADAGDKQSLQELSNLLGENDIALGVATKIDDAEVDTQVKLMDEAIGNPNNPIYTVDKTISPEDIKGTINSNDKSIAGNINLARINSSSDVDDLIRKISEKDATEALKPQSNKQTIAMAKQQNVMLEDLLGRRTTEFSASEAYALRQVLVTSSKQLQQLAIKASSPSGGKLDIVAFERALAVHRTVQNKAVGVASEAGRLLQQFNMTAKDGRGRLRELNNIISNSSVSDTNNKLMREMLASMDDPSQINKFVEKSTRAKAGDAMFEVFTNSILSGPLTHLTNIASTGFALSIAPTESFMRGLSAAARADFKESAGRLGETTAMIHGLAEGVLDSLRLVKNKGNIKSIDFPEELVNMHEMSKQKLKPSITSEELGVQGKAGQFVDFMGNIIRMPGNALLFEDQIFKLLQYRMHTNKFASQEALKLANTPEDARALYTTLKNNPSESITSKSIDMAQYYTFTNDLGKHGKDFQKIANKPGIRYMIPFFRTPTNIVKMGVRHSIFGNVFNDLATSITKATPEGDLARAKLTMGTMIPGSMLMLMGDYVSGRVDESTPTGRFKASQGIPPYSIRIGEKWYSYEKLEPVRSVLGLYANFRESFDNIEQVDPLTGEDNPVVNEMLGAVIGSTVSTVGDNYMLDTVGRIVDILNSLSEGNTELAGKQFERIGSAMLLPNLVKQTNRTFFDNTYRQADGFLQELQKGIPGLSQELPPRYTLWGDEQHINDGNWVNAINPMKTASVNYDKVDNELIDLGVRIPGTPKQITIRGTGMPLDLSPEQQSRFTQIRGKGAFGTPLKKVIKEMINDKGFSKLPPEMRKEEIESVINKATEAAKKIIFSEDETLQLQLKTRLEFREKGLRS